MSEFYISELSNKALVLGSTVAILIIPILLTIGAIYFSYSLSNSKIEITDTSIDFNAAFYGKTVLLDDIDLENVKTIDGSELSIRYRSNGISLFGLNWGWFKGKNGRNALLFITDKTKLVYIPTKLKFDVVVSVDQPQNLVDEIRN